MVKKECQRIRRALPDYLRGHVFALSRTRIKRHLQQCIVCQSEFEGLRRAEETRQMLKDINMPEGVVGRMKEGVFALARLKKVLYRPLWIVGIALIAGAVYYYEVTPRQLDVEIERIVKSEPSTMTDSLPTVTTQEVAAVTAAPSTAQEPLVITITPGNDTSAVQRINKVMRDQENPWAETFSDSIKEVSGSLMAKELTIFINRIKSSAKISYNKKQFKSYSSTDLIPIVLKLKAASKPVVKQTPQHSTEQAAPARPATAPSPGQAEKTAPPATEAAPSPPAAQ